MQPPLRLTRPLLLLWQVLAALRCSCKLRLWVAATTMT